MMFVPFAKPVLKEKLYAFMIVILLLMVDQFSKLIIEWYFLSTPIHTSVAITSFLNIVFVYNRGISFGLFHNGNALTSVVVFMLIISAVIFVFIWLLKAKNTTERFALASILGGALGNIVDRIFRDGVVDFIDFYVQGWHWPAFNCADAFIFIGAAVIIATNIKKT